MPAIATPAGKALLFGQRLWSYLLLARFGANKAAPLPATLPVDVGDLAVTDTGSGLSQVGGLLVVVPKGTPTWGDPAVWAATSVARAAGRAVIGTWTFTVGTASKRVRIGWDTDQASFALEGLQLATDGCAALSAGTAGGVLFSAVVSTPYQIACVLRPTGHLILVKGGVFTAWTLVWVSSAVATTPLFACVTDNEATGTLDDFRVLNLPAPWDGDYGIATSRLVNPGALTAYIHTADCVVEWSFTFTSGAQQRLDYRAQDSSNTWAMIVTTAGGLTLSEVVALGFTTRGTYAAGLANASTHRIVVIAEGNVHRVYLDDALRITYTDTNNLYLTRTSGLVRNAGTTEAVAWPRTIALPSGV